VSALHELGVDARTLPTDPFRGWKYLSTPARGRHGDVVIARYLNDSPKLFKSLCRVAGDALSLIVFRMRGMRVFWICHNVDGETETYWPLSTKVRRWLWGHSAEKIFVTDSSLMDIARASLKGVQEKLTPTSMGLLRVPGKRKREYDEAMLAFLRRDTDSNSPRPRLNILCAGRTGPKYIHFDLLPRLERELREGGWEPRFLAITNFQRDGVWSRGRRYDDFIQWCDNNPAVMLVREYIDFNENEWSEHIDLIWRALSDHSMSFTLFNACDAKIPLLSYQSGHLGQLIQREGIGAMINRDFTNVGPAVDRALAVNPGQFQAFMAKRSWSDGARLLLNAVTSKRLALVDDDAEQDSCLTMPGENGFQTWTARPECQAPHRSQKKP